MFRPLDVAGFCLNYVDYVKRLVKCAHIFFTVRLYLRQAKLTAAEERNC